MSKIFSVKKWLLLDDAAKYLSAQFNEEVSVPDLLQLAIDGQLTISVNLVNHASARMGRLVPVENAKVLVVNTSDKDFKKWIYLKHDQLSPEQVRAIRNILVTERISETDAPYIRAFQENGIPTLDFEGELLPNGKEVFEREPNGKIFSIEGIWDLVPIGNAKLDLEHLYHYLTGGPEITLVSLDGIKLSRVGDPKEWAELQAQLEGKKGRDPENFYPAGIIPEDAVMIVRKEVLVQFVESLSGESEENPDQNVARHEYPPHLDCLVTAWRRFWKNADRLDRDTWPKKAIVEEWLIDQGLSGKTADSGATIITPDWGKRNR